jgi:WD40 repeat protein
MESLTRRGFGLAGVGAALASAGAVRPAGASSLLNPLTSPRGTTYPGRVRLKQVASVDLRGQGDAFSWHVSTMAWSSDGTRLVAVNGLGNFLNVIDTATWRLLERFRIMSSDHRRCFGFSSEGKELMASKRVDPGSSENPPAFSVFEMDTGRIVRESQLLPISIPNLYGKPDDITLQQRRSDQKLTVSPDGGYVFINLSARISGTTRWFNYVFGTGDGHLIATGDNRPFSLPSVSKENYLAGVVTFPSGSLWTPRQEITIYDLPSFNRRLGFPAHIRGVASLAWSPDGSRLVSGSSATVPPREPEPIRVWDSATGTKTAGFLGEFEPVSFVEWHPSGAFFLTKSAKGDENLRGSLVQLFPSSGGAPLLRHFAPDRVVIDGPCFCPRTGRLAWFQQGQILIHEIQGL